MSSLVAESLTGTVRITAQSHLGEGAGTGFVMSTDGRIATNAHVVVGSSKIDVEFADGTTSPAVVLGMSPLHDLAVLQVDRQDLTALPIGKSADLRVGQPVVAIGNALGFEGGHTATDGIVSALDRSITLQDGSTFDGLIQTDAAINPGNSGGPLLSLDGTVIGINSAGSMGAQNIGFAIEIDTALPILEQLATGEPIVQAFLGIATAPIDPRVAERAGLEVTHGLFVSEITVGSAAETAGLRHGDVVVAVDGTDVKAPGDLADVIEAARPGDEVRLDVHRGNESIEVVATLGSRVV
ncbi:MAG: trypsin-like peptidase domain-containing protein [Ilumatobacter sp.]|uniref:S1C family serine protease n=1 Tax=Ilumatobacter sp. TaxID=1967498 RepID=UPI003298C7FC